MLTNSAIKLVQVAVVTALAVSGCTTESSRAVAPDAVAAASASYSGPRAPIAVGKFDNRSPYMRGVFSDGVDRLGSQAKTILIAHLNQSGRFRVMDRDNMKESEKESSIKQEKQALKGADYLITGDVVEFGRKEVGSMALFGILGYGKEQVAYAKVALNVVDVSTSEVVFSVQGAGEYVLSDQSVVGFGSAASYDSTLNGKVLDLAIREAVDRLASSIDGGAWKPVK